MPVTSRNLRFYTLSGLLFLTLILTSAPAFGQFPDIEVFVGDTTGSSGEQNSAISIYMKNYYEEVSGYTLWINLSNPNIMEFQTHLDTIEYETFWRYTEFDPIHPEIPTDSISASLYWVCQQWDGEDCIDSIQLLGYYQCIQYSGEDCIDSSFIEGYDTSHIDTTEAYVGNIDTTGTLTSGWQRVETRSLGGFGQDMLILAFANVATPPYNPGIAAPQYGLEPLIKIRGDVFDIPDDDTNRTVDIKIEYNILDFFGFSDPDGNSIGIVTDTITDTLFFECLDWVIPGEVCNWWNRVDPEPQGGADSQSIITYLSGHLDTEKVLVYNGSLAVLSGTCGDFTGPIIGEPDGDVNILDILYLINFKFKGEAEPSPPYSDVNCDLEVNILDILKMIDHKFQTFAPLNCCPEQWP